MRNVKSLQDGRRTEGRTMGIHNTTLESSAQTRLKYRVVKVAIPSCSHANILIN